MHVAKTLAAGLAAALIAGPAAAEGLNVYAVESRENFCPAGLQPVTADGTICCGTPNQSQTYHEAMRHPAPKRVSHQAGQASTCAEGQKGCY